MYLESSWTFYYDEGLNKPGASQQDYENMMKPLGSFNTVQGFWSFWNYIHQPYQRMPVYFNLRLFRSNIKPLWEDERNINGGKWVYNEILKILIIY